MKCSNQIFNNTVIVILSYVSTIDTHKVDKLFPKSEVLSGTRRVTFMNVI